MKSSIALLGLSASVHALGSSYSECSNSSSIHHATMVLTKDSTATLTSIPTNIDAAPGRGDENSAMIYATATQTYTFTTTLADGSATTITGISNPSSPVGSSVASAQVSSSNAPAAQGPNAFTTTLADGSATTITGINNPSSSVASNTASPHVSLSASPHVSLSASAAPSDAPAAQGSYDQSRNAASSSSFPSISIGAPSQWSTQSRSSAPITTATSFITSTSNSTSPKSSMLAFTGSASTTSTTGGAMIIALFLSILLL